MLTMRVPLPAFRSVENIIHGPNSLAALRGLSCARAALIVSGSLARQADLLDTIARNIRCHSLEIIEKSWTGEPSIDDLKGPIRQLEQSRPDVIIAAGGGSVLDAAKLMWMFYEHPELEAEVYQRAFAIPPLRGRAKFVCIPTTIGTGSEVSSSALFNDQHTGRKIPVVTHDFLPDVIILDPMMVADLPIDVAVSTVCDALSHAIEGYVSQIDNPIMDVMAEKAVQVIFEGFPSLFDNNEPNVSDLSRLQYAAMMAGWVQNHCLVGASHAIAHQLSGYGVGHGQANAILLPAVVRMNAQDNDANEKYTKLAQASGVGDDANALASWVESVREKGDFALALGAFGTMDHKSIVLGALDDPAAPFNPVELNADNLTEILEVNQ